MQAKSQAQLAKMHAETEFEKYRVVQDRLYQTILTGIWRKVQNKDGGKQLYGREGKTQRVD